MLNFLSLTLNGLYIIIDAYIPTLDQVHVYPHLNFLLLNFLWQNALYINSSILIIYHYKSYCVIFTIYTETNFDNNACILEHLAIANAREL